MKKGIYRAVDLKQIDVEMVNSRLVGDVAQVAVDAAKELQYAAIRPKGGDVIQIVKWTLPGEMDIFVQFLASLDAVEVEVILESTSTYGDTTRHHAWLVGATVYQVSGKRVKDAAEVYDGVPSNHDAKAAWLIGRLHQDGASQIWKEQTRKTRQVRAAVKTKAMFDQGVQRALGRLEAELARYWPELPNLLKLKAVSLAKLLEAYGGPLAVARDPNGARKLLKKVGRYFLANEKIERVIESAQNTTGCPMIEDECTALKLLAGELLHQRKRAQDAEKRVCKLVEDNEELEQAQQCFGKSTTAVFYTLVGDPRDYGSTGALVKGFGLNMKIWSSGKKKGQLHITKRGSGSARWYMYMAALRMIKKDPIVRAWYARKVARDGGKMKLKAVVAVMRKLVKALWHVGRGKRFDASLLFDGSRLQLTGPVEISATTA